MRAAQWVRGGWQEPSQVLLPAIMEAETGYGGCYSSSGKKGI